jgi:hypothetical protein
MDIAVTVITVAVVLFFVAVILSNVPWGRVLGRRKEEEKVELARQIYFYVWKNIPVSLSQFSLGSIFVASVQ